MRRMVVLTSTREEYGLFAPVVCELRKFEGSDFRADLVVTGTHLSPEYGMTIEEIRVNELLDDVARRAMNVSVYVSLGVRRRLSPMRYALFVQGNSSSGIIKAPAFRAPTVNIGDRQKGRLRVAGVIDCLPKMGTIFTVIKEALNPELREVCLKCDLPYGSDRAAPLIAGKRLKALSSGIDLKKCFHDIV